MFDQIFGLPMHVLVIHAVVALVPLSVLLALAYAVLPGWRWALRWPMVAGAVVALGTAFVAKQSGEALLARLGQTPPGVALHQERGNLLVWILVGFLLVVSAAAILLGGPTRLVGGRERPGASRAVQLIVAVLLIGVAVWSGVQVVLTGDAGARAVWG